VFEERLLVGYSIPVVYRQAACVELSDLLSELGQTLAFENSSRIPPSESKGLKVLYYPHLQKRGEGKPRLLTTASRTVGRP
jgi:hypothetical protein